jgi:hypothetical protein
MFATPCFSLSSKMSGRCKLLQIMTLSPILIAIAAAAVLAPVPALAAPLTIRPGESWVFELERGEPARARKVNSSVKPAANQIKASLVSTMGTTMTISNNSRRNYTFRAELVGAGGAAPGKARTCTLPADGAPVFEYWPVKATAVRLSGFKLASADGNCP